MPNIHLLRANAAIANAPPPRKGIDWAAVLSCGGRFFFSNRHLFAYVFGSAALSKGIANGLSYGPSYDGFDIRLAEGLRIPSKSLRLGVSLECFRMPKAYRAIVHDKSSLIRQGVVVGNSVIEPGWEGYLTLEIANWGAKIVSLPPEQPIAQICFVRCNFWLWKVLGMSRGYSGKYQSQPQVPVEAKLSPPPLPSIAWGC